MEEVKTIEPILGVNKFHCEDETLLPRRSTINSAGYDFIAPDDYVVPAHGMCLINSRVSVELKTNCVLLLFVRSSYGFKYGVTLANGTGVIDSDFYPNEMRCKLRNDSDEDLIIHKGDHYMQGVIVTFCVAEDEIVPETVRNGGIGSTGK